METFAKSGTNLVVTTERQVSYNYKNLLAQKTDCERRIADYQAQLNKINTLIAEADKLGLNK